MQDSRCGSHGKGGRLVDGKVVGWDIPLEILEMSEKKEYNSVGLAVKANDVQGAKDVVEFLKTERHTALSNEEWTFLLFNALPGMTIEMAQYLRESGADIAASMESKEDSDRTQSINLGYALMQADNVPLLQWMLDEGWVDEKMTSPAGDTLLVQAIREHAFETAQLFMDKGMSIDHQNLRGVCAFHEAASSGDYRALEWLMQRQADPTLETMMGAVPSELVPTEADDAQEAEMLYDAVDAYYVQFKRAPHLAEVPQFITDKSTQIRKLEEPEPPPAPEAGTPKRAPLRT